MCITSFCIQSATKDEFEIFVENTKKKMFEEQKGEKYKKLRRSVTSNKVMCSPMWFALLRIIFFVNDMKNTLDMKKFENEMKAVNE